MVKKYVKIKGKSPALVDEEEIEGILAKYVEKPKKAKKKKEVKESEINGN